MTQKELHDLKARLEHWRLIKEQNVQNEEERAQGEVADALDEFILTYGYVLLSEVADWMRKEQGFDVSVVESSIPKEGEIAQMLTKWFGSPIDDLPPKLREIAEAYIPNWPELSGTDRRARADEADRQLQAKLGARFEQARKNAEQANAAIPERFAEREFQYGFNSVVRKKKGERDFEAKRGAVNLSDERCIELARKPELGIVEWVELTGVGIGECHGFFLVATDGVSFIKHDLDFIKSAPAEWQIDMLRDNRHEPLKFPCTPARMIDFIDSELCMIRGCFSVPDTFQQAVTAIAQATDTAPQVPEEAREQAAPSGTSEKAAPEVTLDDDGQGGKGLVAWQAVMLENWPKIAEHDKKPPARAVMKWLRENGPHDTFPKGQNNRDSLPWRDTYGQLHTLTLRRIGTVLSEWRKTGKIPA